MHWKLKSFPLCFCLFNMILNFILTLPWRHQRPHVSVNLPDCLPDARDDLKSSAFAHSFQLQWISWNFFRKKKNIGEFDLSFYVLRSWAESFLNFQQTVRLYTILACEKTRRARDLRTDCTRNVSIMPKKPQRLCCKGSCFSDRLVNSYMKDRILLAG